MSAPAAIAASLVNMRNVGTHKSVALTIHVPEEQAQSVIEAFGWPTMTAPVPVAIARLNETVVGETAQDEEAPPLGHPEGSRPATSSSAPRKQWADLPPSQQAAMRCGEPEFGRFLGIRYDTKPQEDTAAVVRRLCGVESRRDLDTDQRSRVLWHQLDTEYLVATGKMAAPR